MPDKKTELVTAHTPDETAYHTGISPYGTTIPRSTKDGASLGFDPHKPGKVIVDPDMEDGNLEVDFSKFGDVSDLNNKIQIAVGDTPDADGAFQAFSNIAAELAEMAEGGSKTSSSAPSQVLKKEPGNMDKPRLKKPQMQVPPVGDVSSPKVETSQDNEALRSVLEQQSALLGQLTSQVADLHKEQEAVVQLEEERASTPEAEEEVEENMPEAIALPQECLEMPFLGLPKPVKPTKEIYFEMPQAGTMGARYHEVIEGGSCIALVYDTRYEDGYQWIPPALGDTKIQMTIPKENKTFTCSSLGIHFHIGVLDVVVLFKHDSDVIKENY